jgi:hypothetical protein
VRKLRQAMARSIDGSGGSLRDTDMITWPEAEAGPASTPCACGRMPYSLEWMDYKFYITKYILL